MKKSKIRLPKVKDYRTVRHATANENGVEELALESYLTLWEKLKHMIIYQTFETPPSRTSVYVMKGSYWADKKTGQILDETTQYECFEAKVWIRSRMDLHKDHWNTFLEK